MATITGARETHTASPHRPALAMPQRVPARVPGWWRDAVGVAAWLSMLIVVALWIAGGGIQAMGTVAGAFTSLGRLTGLISADLLLIQVLLIARIPMVERVYGHDVLARRHRLVGFWSFNLMLAHLVAIVIGYALASNLNPFVQFWEMTVDYPGMLLALAGTLLLVLVTVTSIRKARKKLRYESWHLLHLYAYLGVGLAIPHQLWTGQEFLTSAFATIYWWGLWIAAVAAIGIWRVGVPLYRTFAHDLRVTAVVRESPDVVSVWMRGRNLLDMPVAAGQFFNWRFLSGPGWSRSHPYSLSAAPTDNTLRITVKDLGDGSHALASVKPGSRVVIEGPYGRLHNGVRTRGSVTLMASGIGISPLRALLEDLPAEPGDVTLLYRARSRADLVLREELEAIATRTGARVYYLVGRRLPGRPSWLPESAGPLSDADALAQLVPDIATNDVFLCGADAWMDAARQAAIECGVPAANIHDERFSW
jgi:predicted ferric reductase